VQTCTPSPTSYIQGFNNTEKKRREIEVLAGAAGLSGFTSYFCQFRSCIPPFHQGLIKLSQTVGSLTSLKTASPSGFCTLNPILRLAIIL
jgi:hypothetical protein